MVLNSEWFRYIYNLVNTVTLDNGWLRASVVSQHDVPSSDRGPGGSRGNGINNW